LNFPKGTLFHRASWSIFNSTQNGEPKVPARVFIEVIMRCLLIRCARCQKDDTEAVLDEINKVCAEFGIKHGIAQLSSVAQAVVSGRREHMLKREEKEVAKHVALRLLTMMTDTHYCEFCREKVAEKEKREALRQKFKVIIGKKG
jgi:hypothetical protein